MNLIKGKFYTDGGELIPLEFGNKEQIEIMQRALRQFNALTGDGLKLDVSYETTVLASVDFKCICGQTIWREKEVESEEHVTGMNGVCRCPKCKQVYKIDFDDDGELIAKINKRV